MGFTSKLSDGHPLVSEEVVKAAGKAADALFRRAFDLKQQLRKVEIEARGLRDMLAFDAPVSEPTDIDVNFTKAFGKIDASIEEITNAVDYYCDFVAGLNAACKHLGV